VRGVQNRTVPLKAATLYVLNNWVKEQNLVPKEKESWDALRAKWMAEGIPKKERDRMEAKNLLGILQCMPVFVMQNGRSITPIRCSGGLSVSKSILTSFSATSATMATGRVNRSWRERAPWSSRCRGRGGLLCGRRR
jgi:hypothetical protein